MYFADAQTTFYITGVVFMIFFMALATAFLIVILVMMQRIRAMRKKARQRLDYFFSFARKGAGFMEGFRRGMNQRP